MLLFGMKLIILWLWFPAGFSCLQPDTFSWKKIETSLKSRMIFQISNVCWITTVLHVNPNWHYAVCSPCLMSFIHPFCPFCTHSILPYIFTLLPTCLPYGLICHWFARHSLIFWKMQPKLRLTAVKLPYLLPPMTAIILCFLSVTPATAWLQNSWPVFLSLLCPIRQAAPGLDLQSFNPLFLPITVICL